MTKKDIIVNNLDELIDIIFDRYYELKQSAKDSKTQPEIKDAFWYFGIGDDINTVQLIDNRTFYLIRHYEYYKNNPDRAFEITPAIWFESVLILNNYFQVRLF